MPVCPRCSRETPAGSRFCPACAAPLGAAPEDGPLDGGSPDGATRTSVPSGSPRDAAPSPPTPAPPPGTPTARFLPGTVIAGRYRVVGLLGRGGMGEVYRADDLKLGQPVALKFLPREFERDASRRARLMTEVRMALRITHPAVCRVHDVGESDGRHFISMEYVDGEDLASLLRRIGRLPQERATEIARQICAGLAAAHEQGILHRDLKPANVMIDGRGRAKITDFGLADLAGAVDGADVRAGTPAYMAPEQLDGREVTARSDVYALGLVLYELFTGKPAFRAARSVAELARARSTPPTSPTSHVRGLDPAIEAAILRALDPDPARRPASALAVAAALPGGDPLAAALAAGETPSPEMVAEAGEEGGLAAHWIALCLLVVLGGVAAVASIRPSFDVLGHIETPHSVAALRERAQLMTERLGFGDAPAWTAHGVVADHDYLRWLASETDDMVPRVETERPAVYAVWYRSSPRRMVPDEGTDRVRLDDPPLDVPGMVRIALDSRGRLVELEAVPPDRDPEPRATADGTAESEGESESEAEADAVWSALLREAEIDEARFRRVEPRHTPLSYADARAAWEGAFAESPDTPVRIEAAAYRGMPVSFRTFGAWSRDRGSPEESSALAAIGGWFAVAFLLAFLAGLALLARRSLRSGRADVRGAVRVGGFLFAVELVAALVGGGYLFGPDRVVGRLIDRFSFVVLVSTIVFLSYVAFEPYVRRIWPTTLISWSRLLAGRFRDPLVARDVLIGAAAGIVNAAVIAFHMQFPPVLGLTPEPMSVEAAWRSHDAAVTLSQLLSELGSAIGSSMVMLLVLVLFRLLTRRSWVAVALFFVVSLFLPNIGSPHYLLDVAMTAALLGISLFVLLRVGLLGFVALSLVQSLGSRVATLDPSSWVGPSSMMALAALLLVVGVAAVLAAGGRRLLDDEV